MRIGKGQIMDGKQVSVFRNVYVSGVSFGRRCQPVQGILCQPELTGGSCKGGKFGKECQQQ